MAQDKLTIGIGADIEDLQKGIAQAEKELYDLRKQKRNDLKLGVDTTEVNKSISETKAKLSSLQSYASGAGNAMQTFEKQTANGGNALTAFSRIAQDAPYGIIGVGNNITNTAEQFGYLVKQTGSAKGAVSAMLSSLAGVGGIMLGVSLLVTGLTVMQQKGITVGDVFDKLTGQYNEFNNALKVASEEGTKSAMKEVVGLQSLVAMAQNDNLAKKDRLIAVEKLQSQFPAYYGNLSKEQIMYGDLTKATHEATKALIAKSVAEKLGDKAGDKFIERMNAQQKFNDAKERIDKFDQESAKRGISNYQELTKLEFSKLSAQEKVSHQLSASRKEQRKSLVADAEVERQSLISVLNQYEKIINVVDKLNQISAPLAQSAPKKGKDSLQKTDAREKINGLENSLIPRLELNVSDPEPIITGFIQKVQAGLTETQMLLLEFNTSVNELINTSVNQTFSNLGNSIGEALANGTSVLSAMGSSLLQSFGGFLTQLGQEMIKYGLLLTGFGKAQAAFMAGDPVTKIGAGIAMVALGVAVSAAGSAISTKGSGSPRASGGQSIGGGGSNANFQTSTSGFSSQSSNGGTVVFEIAGQKLLGVLSNTVDSNNRLGGGTNPFRL